MGCLRRIDCQFLPPGSRYQYNFSANCISRDVRWYNGGFPALVMVPTLNDPICALGLLNCGVFSRLKHSARNCRRMALSGLNVTLLNMDTSNCVVPGPVRILRPELP